MQPIELGQRTIGDGFPCFIIAEAGVNHNGDLALACDLIVEAARAGADAVKFQSFVTAKVLTRDAPKAAYQRETTGAAGSQYDMVSKLELSAAAHRELADVARAQKIMFLSTPFDDESADLLDALGVPLFKVGSGELTNTQFLQRLARRGKPLVLSTGMATLSEVETAVNAVRQACDVPLALLQCVSNYPAALSDTNLRAMATMRERFDVVVGYSDHTLGNSAALSAVALGAAIVEKHFTLSSELPGPDHRASADPQQLRALIQGIREVEAALGNGIKEPSPRELDTARVARRSLASAVALPAGTRLREPHITALRPGSGIPPGDAHLWVGRVLKVDVAAGVLLEPGMFE